VRISQRMQAKQSQRLHMSPQLQQSIQVLQMNNLELTELLQTEAEQNPFLELADGDDAGAHADDPAGADATTGEVSDPQIVTGPTDGTTPEFSEIDYSHDASSPNELTDVPTTDDVIASGHLGDATIEAEDEGWREEPRSNLTDFLAGQHEAQTTTQVIEEVVAEHQTLADYLQMQVIDASPDADLRHVCLALVGWIDENGYLRESNDEICAGLDITPAVLDAALTLLRGLNPGGIFARDLKDCLLLQWQRLPNFEPSQRMLLEYLDLLAQGKLEKLAEICDMSTDELRRSLRELQSLNPRPAADFIEQSVGPQAPEILIRRDGAGWQVSLNEDLLPRILVRERDWEEMAKRPMSEADRRFLATNMQSARWLLRATQQRAITMLRVAQAVVDHQEAFLQKGQRALKPMVLREIAETLDLHESTISRTVANKLVDTPTGIFALKDLFSAALTGGIHADGQMDNNGGASAAGVKARIRNLVDAEMPDRIISDDMIVETLKDEGIVIARRTVAKYRESLNIPSSVVRRRAHRIHGLAK